MVYSLFVCIFYLFVSANSLVHNARESDGSHLQKRDLQNASVAEVSHVTSSTLGFSSCPLTGNAKPRNCRHALQLGHSVSGIYEIDPRDGLGSFDVYCDMETDGGGWTVFQRRKDGSENFNRKWNDYVQGFGHLYGEFWLGLDKIHRLATSVDLRIDLMAFDGETAYAQYEYFTIGDSRSSYVLYFGQYNGNAGDSLGHHRGMKFSTSDKDNDVHSSSHCAAGHKGAWWYGACSQSNLNSLYKFGGTGWTHVVWSSFKETASLQRAEMKLQ
ncbi:fibrinogen C domain-containing protein 1-like [Corticium candelabrum]|uniref:fibrinogen C domain-containing protein 1-like n=1 Tax=Corticium candelabrum TaxID=121492 RepID=UPI002E273850|nr:fibrinogen C domain-containing protein 1-like [Corticium candelabrum]